MQFFSTRDRNRVVNASQAIAQGVPALAVLLALVQHVLPRNAEGFHCRQLQGQENAEIQLRAQQAQSGHQLPVSHKKGAAGGSAVSSGSGAASAVAQKAAYASTNDASIWRFAAFAAIVACLVAMACLAARKRER